MNALPWRLAVRAVVLDPARRVPLVRFRDRVWALPGGGIEPRGSDEEALLLRELVENGPPAGPPSIGE
jgi:8-oxo-dGTP pyrophosphatase MutT (NUDIX family)